MGIQHIRLPLVLLHGWKPWFLTAKAFAGDFLLLLFGSGSGNRRQGERDRPGLGGEIAAPPPSSPLGFLVPVE